MTREEEIDHAKMTYLKGLNYDPSVCFEEGVECAYNHPKSPWISVDEKLPPEEKDGLSIKVLVVSTKNKITFSRYDYGVRGWISTILDIEFTHWMPLPEPPKRTED